MRPQHSPLTASCAEGLHGGTWPRRSLCYTCAMFTIEHEFDATVITLIDEGTEALQEDITILAFEECVVLEQIDQMTNEVVRITLSPAQLADLAAAMDLPEGSYRIEKHAKSPVEPESPA